MSAARPVAVLASALVALGGLVAGATGASATDLSDVGARSFADLASCAATSDHLLAAIVVDESGSLRSTDPDDRRVPAITTALDALEQLGTSSGRLDVQATIATFGQTSTTLVDWGTVSGGHAAALHDAVTGELPSRDRANFTDYRVALRSAQTALADRAASLDGSSCKVVLWFTDGRLDVDGTGDGPATVAAREELCAPQGVIDAVRADGVTVVALALFTEDGQGSVTPQDRERLRAIAEGSSGQETCGTVPVPASSSGGAYLRADDATAVRRLFAQAAALIAGGTPGISVVCPDDTCVDGRLSIPVDAGVGSFRLTVEHDADASAGKLLAPDGTVVALDAPSSDVDGAAVTTSTRDGFTVVDVRVDRSRPGAWTFVADPGRSAVVDLFWFWGLALDVDAPDGVVLGEPSVVRVVPRHLDGTPVDLDALEVDLEVTVNGVVHPAERSDDGWSVTVDVPTSDAVTAVDVDVTARATTSPHAIALGPVATSARLTTRFPPSFPTPGHVTLDRIVGDATVTGELELTGAERGATQACVASVDASGPQAAGTVDVRTDPECVEVPADGTARIAVTVGAEHAADGRVEGALRLHLTGVDGDVLETAVPFGTSMVRPVDEGRRWGLVAVMFAGALALAWATFEVSRRVADRYVLTSDARAAAVPVLLTASGLQRTDGRDGPLLDPALDFRAMGVTGRTRPRSFETQGVEFGRRYKAWPWTAGEAWVTATGGNVVVTEDLDGAPADRSRARTRFPGTTGWVLVTERPQDDEIRGRLVVVVDSRRGVASVLPARLDQLGYATHWDLVTERVRAAWATRDEAAAARAPRPRAKERAASSAPATEAPQRSSSFGDTPDGEAPRRSSFLDDVPTGDDTPRRPSFLDEPPTSTGGPRRPSSLGDTPIPRPSRDAPAPSPSPRDDEKRPPSVNFWD